MVTGKVLYHWKRGMLFLEEITNSDSFQARYLHSINTGDWLHALNDTTFGALFSGETINFPLI